MVRTIDPASLRARKQNRPVPSAGQWQTPPYFRPVSVNGTFGSGNVGTDLNALPAAGIEAHRDPARRAAAQYGSDAIAGVINLIMRTITTRPRRLM